ncbi:MAG: DNA mismatch repair endonuclease MutH [Gammaproteobacteria bacterium]
MSPVAPPQTLEELLHRTRAIAGCSLQELAQQQQQRVPEDMRHAKGWTGQLLEQVLGADAASLAQPDFRALGVELKTLPVLANGQPKESTYVCTVPLQSDGQSSWQQSWVRRKLQCILWLPIEADPAIAPGQRRVGSALLCQPDSRQHAILQQDWEEHMDLILLGRVDEISAHQGTYLQVRPKAADHTALRMTTDNEGNMIRTLPRGFYLRSCFTAEILATHYA